MKHYQSPELVFDFLQDEDILTSSTPNGFTIGGIDGTFIDQVEF